MEKSENRMKKTHLIQIDLDIKNINNRGNTPPDLNKTIHFKIQTRKFNFVIGDSGSGKTLSSLAINDLLDKREWQGIDTSHESTRTELKNVAYIFQEPRSYLDPSFRLKDQLPDDSHILSNSNNRNKKLTDLLKIVQFDHSLLDRYPHQISGGERQKALTIIALHKLLSGQNIDLLIADEPTSSLDFMNQEIILELFKQLIERKKVRAILFITHDQLLVADFWEKNKALCHCYQFPCMEEISSFTQLYQNCRHLFRNSLQTDPIEPANIQKSKPILEIRNLSISNKNGVGIVETIDLSVFPNQIIGILGESGCGKTTVISYILGVLSESVWECSIVSEFTDNRIKNNKTKLQAAFQDSDQVFNPNMNLREILSETYELIQKNGEVFDDWAHEILAKANIGGWENADELLRRYPSQFSGGEIQRLAFLRALAVKPLLLISDEPFSRLDMVNKFKMAALINQAKDENTDSAFIIASHDLQTMAYLCDKIIVLKKEKNKPSKVDGTITRRIIEKTKEILWETSGNGFSSDGFLLQVKDQLLSTTNALLRENGFLTTTNQLKTHNFMGKANAPSDNAKEIKDTKIDGRPPLSKEKSGLEYNNDRKIHAVRCSPDMKYLVRGYEDGSILVKSLTDDRVHKIAGHNCADNSIYIHFAGKYFTTTASDCTVKLWEYKNFPFSNEFKGHKAKVNSVTFSPVRKHLVSGDSDGNVIAWELSTSKILWERTVHGTIVNSICFLPNGKQLISGGSDNCICLRNYKNNDLIGEKKFTQEKMGSVNSVCFSPDCIFFLSSNSDLTVRLLSLDQAQPIKFFNHLGGANNVFFSLDGKFVIRELDKSICVWDVNEEKVVVDQKSDSGNVISTILLSKGLWFKLISFLNSKAKNVRFLDLLNFKIKVLVHTDSGKILLIDLNQKGIKKIT